jgi:mercuric ion binding protein
MKRTLLTLALAAAPLLALAQPQSLRAEVNGMVCSFCAQGIEKRMKTLPATQAVWVDLKNKTVAVEMKPGQRIDEATFRQEMKEAGYDVVRVEQVALSAAQIRAQRP